MNITRIVAMTLLLSAWLTGSRVCATDANETQAIAAARAWLKLVDNGNYAKAWQEAGSLMKSQISQQALQKQVGNVRKPLGSVVSRAVGASKTLTTLPGGPDGKYVVIQFDTKFQHKAEAVETVTPMLDKDGKWRVSGYYIK